MISRAHASIIFLGFSAVFSLLKGIAAAYLLSLEEFGSYSVIMSFVILSVLLISFAVEPRYLRAASRVLYLAKDDMAFDTHFFSYSTALIWNLFFSLLPIGLMAYIFDLTAKVMVLIVVFSFVSANFNLSLASIRISGKYIEYSIMLLLRSLCVIFIYFLIPDDKKNAQYFIISDLIVCSFCYIYVNYKKRSVLRSSFINFSRYITILKAGWGYSSSYIARTGLVMIDRPVIALIQGSAIVGLFSIYLIPMQIAIGVMGLLSVYIQPWGLNCNNSGEVGKILKFINRYLALVFLISTLFLLSFYYSFDYLHSFISYDVSLEECLLSISIALLVLLNVFDPLYLVLGKGKEQFKVSALFACLYCLTLLVYFYLELDYVILLWCMLLLRLSTFCFGFFYINIELNNRRVR